MPVWQVWVWVKTKDTCLPHITPIPPQFFLLLKWIQHMCMLPCLQAKMVYVGVGVGVGGSIKGGKTMCFNTLRVMKLHIGRDMITSPSSSMACCWNLIPFSFFFFLNINVFFLELSLLNRFLYIHIESHDILQITGYTNPTPHNRSITQQTDSACHFPTTSTHCYHQRQQSGSYYHSI